MKCLGKSIWFREVESTFLRWYDEVNLMHLHFALFLLHNPPTHNNNFSIEVDLEICWSWAQKLSRVEAHIPKIWKNYKRAKQSHRSRPSNHNFTSRMRFFFNAFKPGHLFLDNISLAIQKLYLKSVQGALITNSTNAPAQSTYKLYYDSRGC